MIDSRVTERYVKSLMGLAIEKNVLEAVHQDMQQIDAICHSSRPFLSMLRSPVIRHDKKRQVLKLVLENKINPLTYAIVDMLTKKNREPILPSIASYFHVAYMEYKQIGQATITSAVPLNDSLEKEIQSIVQKLSGKKQVELTKKVDSQLIGGFVLEVGNSRLDTSVKHSLQKIEQQLVNQSL